MNFANFKFLHCATTWSQKIASTFLVGFLLLGLQSASQAAMLTVNLTGFDIRFKGGQTDIVDDDSDMYSPSGNPAYADDLDAATITNNNTMMVIGDWMKPANDIRGDLRIEDSLPTLAPDTLTPLTLAGGTNEFLWFVDDGTKLRLRFDTFSVQRTTLPAGLPEIFVMTGSATVLEQSLPQGMAYQDVVGFAYVATDSVFLNNSDGLALTGVVTITGEMIPEPTVLSLVGFGLLVVGTSRVHLSQSTARDDQTVGSGVTL